MQRNPTFNMEDIVLKYMWHILPLARSQQSTALQLEERSTVTSSLIWTFYKAFD